MKYYEISKIFRGQRYAGVSSAFSAQAEEEDQAVQEENQRAQDNLDEANKNARERGLQTVQSLNAILPTEPIVEDLASNNLFSLSPGSHGGNILKKDGTQMQGIAIGAVINKPLVIESDCVLDNLMFRPSSSISVLVKSPARVVFRGCTFDKLSSDSAAHMTVESGAKVVILGCVFQGGVAGGTAAVVSSAAANADVQIAFCVNTTGNTLVTGNSTTTGCVS